MFIKKNRYKEFLNKALTEEYGKATSLHNRAAKEFMEPPLQLNYQRPNSISYQDVNNSLEGWKRQQDKRPINQNKQRTAGNLNLNKSILESTTSHIRGVYKLRDLIN